MKQRKNNQQLPCNLQEHFGRCQQRRRHNDDSKSAHSSDSSVSFSDTVLGQLLAKEGLIADQDFEVECRGSKKHLYASLVAKKSSSSSSSSSSPFRRPNRASTVGSVLPTYPTADLNGSSSSIGFGFDNTAVSMQDDDFDGDDLYLSFSLSESFSKRIIFSLEE